MSQLDKDVETARRWLLEVATELMSVAIKQSEVVNQIVDKVKTIAACADLPGDMALRVRLLPNAFNSKC